jgi:8-oxo-dGTP pyrophosphatase MutT (NUDIX family)/transcriptional regulator with XRE-family HTH domain
MATPTTPAEILAGNIAAARGRRRLQQADLADRMRALGWKWVRQTVGEIENGRRRVSSDELIGLSYALETDVGNLLLPAPGEVRIAALPAGHLVILPLQHEMPDGMGASVLWDGNRPRFNTAGGTSPARTIARPKTPTKESELQPVAAAIVTSRLGVLVGRRNDGKPPWTFIAGEVEPGESPEFAAVRETKEETGLETQAREEIGRRVHPKTGRTMIYVAAEPVRPGDLDVFVGDSDELAEVRWIGLAEADELLPGMFEPVREHLAREIGGA